MIKTPKTQLTPEEAIEVAYWHHVRGYPQHDLAALFHVNAGRVAEACKAFEWTSNNVKTAYKIATE